ncbi:cellulose synthase subunit BcsC-related outer membrane protein [Shigella flexneri]
MLVPRHRHHRTTTRGTCAERDVPAARNQSARCQCGCRLAKQRLGWDIGTTPMGFDVVDVVGSLSYSNDRPIGYTVIADRRPISSSVLAFAGQKIPEYQHHLGWRACHGGGVSVSHHKGER